MVLFSLFEVANTYGGAVEEINYSLWILASEVKRQGIENKRLFSFWLLLPTCSTLGTLCLQQIIVLCAIGIDRDVQVVNCMHLLIIYICVHARPCLREPDA